MLLRQRLPALALALGICFVALAGCRAKPAPNNVIVVLVDALRADRLSLYGYERPTSPELDRLARERGVVFRNAWANAGCTWASVSSLLTGRWPQRIVAQHGKTGMRIPAELPTLAERFAARGWSTAGVSTSFANPRASAEGNREMFSRGFATYDNRCMSGPASCVNEVALRLLDGLPEPFFLYLHYFDPHAPYNPPENAPRHFTSTGEDPAERWIERGNANPVLHGLYRGDTRELPAAEVVRRFSDLYDEEVRYFDARFGELMADLERRGLLERSVVVLVSDHGEELFENGEWGHCRSLSFDSVLRTPLVFFVPELAAGHRDTAVSNVDVGPTVLDQLGLPFDAAEFDGESLRGILENGETATSSDRVIFAAEGVVRVAANARRTVRFDLRKRAWIGHDGAVLEELPGGIEERLAESRLRRELLRWIRENEGKRVRRSIESAEALEQELKAIGYL